MLVSVSTGDIYMNKLVSVIIPCYNAERYIEATMDSVLLQTYTNLEVLVIDDGSTDRTNEILRKYIDKVILLRHYGGVNKGRSASVNLALNACHGEYIAFLDHDDLWEVNKTEVQVGVLEKNPDVGLVYANGYAINENDERLYQLFPKHHRETNSSESILLNCYIPSPSSSLIRRSVLLKTGGFDGDMEHAADHDLLIRISEVSTMAYVDQHLWRNREHSACTGKLHCKEMWQAGFRILKKACERSGYGWDIKRRRLAVLNFRLSQCLLQEKKYMRFMLHLLVSGILDPVRAAKVALDFRKSK
jgi:glycosyltransferase involved in cell wall biosynthesis